MAINYTSGQNLPIIDQDKTLELDLRTRLKQMVEKNHQLDPIENHSKIYETLMRKMQQQQHQKSLVVEKVETPVDDFSSVSDQEANKKIEDLLTKFRYHNMGTICCMFCD